MNRTLRIAVAEDQDDTREYFQELLPRLGHQVVAVHDGRQLVEVCRASPPDLVITDILMPGMDGLEAAAAVHRERPVPVIVVSAFHQAELLDRAGQGPVMAYLIKPVTRASVEAAIATALSRFEELQAAHKEADSLRQALEERKVIERAKGAVMQRLGLGERDAYRRLRQASSHSNRKLIDVARTVLDAEQVFRSLDDTGSDGQGGG